MAFLPYIRLSLRGTIDVQQSWSINMSFSNDGTATNAELLTWLGSVDGLTKTWFGTAAVKNLCWDANTTYTHLAAYSYPAVGPAASQAQLFSAGVVGTGGGSCPRQCAVVHSLRSGVSGRSGRGRFYMPNTNNDFSGANGQLPSSTCTALATAFKTWVDGMNVLSVGSAPAILGIAGASTGQHVISTDVVVNSLVDTQRRRTDKLAANFQAVAIF